MIKLKRFDEAIRWYNQGKLDPYIKSEIEENYDEFIELSLSDIKIGLKLYGSDGELFGTVIDTTERPNGGNFISVNTKGNSKFMTVDHKLMEYGFLIKNPLYEG
jgi:hypothetical protein